MRNDTRMRDINPFGLRMQIDLKEALDREAKINGRSLNAEIVDRLRKSLNLPIFEGNGFSVEQPTPARYGSEINDVERQMLALFRRMPVEKQLALLSLFK